MFCTCNDKIQVVQIQTGKVVQTLQEVNFIQCKVHLYHMMMVRVFFIILENIFCVFSNYKKCMYMYIKKVNVKYIFSVEIPAFESHYNYSNVMF